MCDLSTANFKTQNYFLRTCRAPLALSAGIGLEMQWDEVELCQAEGLMTLLLLLTQLLISCVTLSTCLCLLRLPRFFNCKMRQLGFLFKILSHSKILWGSKVVKRNGNISLLQRYSIEINSPNDPFFGRGGVWPQNWWVRDPSLVLETPMVISWIQRPNMQKFSIF